MLRGTLVFGFWLFMFLVFFVGLVFGVCLLYCFDLDCGLGLFGICG